MENAFIEPELDHEITKQMATVSHISCLAFASFVNTLNKSDYVISSQNPELYYHRGQLNLHENSSSRHLSDLARSENNNVPIFNDLMVNKSCLFTTIVRPNKLTAIKKQLCLLGQLFVERDITTNWTMQLIQQQAADGYYLIDLFLTNNQEPQIVNLGYEAARYLKDLIGFEHLDLDITIKSSESGLEAKSQLVQNLSIPFYYYQPVSPSKLWQKQIISNLKPTDLQKAQEKIDQQFNVFQGLTRYKTRKLDNAHAIEILDFFHFYHFMPEIKTSEITVKNKTELLTQIQQAIAKKGT